jgi:hypothetical protein
VIKIVRQDSIHQYNSNGDAITTWNKKYCCWIINKEYENEIIDWQADENGITEFPGGVTEEEFRRDYPDIDKYPDIHVTWYWDRDGYFKAFSEYPKDGVMLTCTRYWGYLNYSESEAIERLGHYCKFNKFSYRTVITYNNTVIHDGELK